MLPLTPSLLKIPPKQLKKLSVIYIIGFLGNLAMAYAASNKIYSPDAFSSDMLLIVSIGSFTAGVSAFGAFLFILAYATFKVKENG